MKRLVVLALMVSMSFGIVPAAEAGGKAAPREEAQEYSMPRAVGADTDLPGLLVGYALFEPGSARAVSFAVEDVASPNVLAVVAQNDRVLSTFCTATDKPLRISQSFPLEVRLYVGVCDGTPSFITTGVIRATYGR